MILDFLYSRRHKKDNNLFPDIFVYEPMSEKLKITLYKIFDRTFSECSEVIQYKLLIDDYYRQIHDAICEEHSFHYLVKPHGDYRPRVLEFFHSNKDILIDLDILTMVFYIIDKTSKNYYGERLLSNIHTINQRMLEHGFGYQYENGILVRIDSKHTHSEIIKPALSLLQDQRFKNADDEFRQAFEAYKSGNYEEAIRVANNSFESTMKIICNLKGYGLPAKHTATALIEHLRSNDFVPGFQTEAFKGLAKCMESVSTVRNNVAGHGQGDEKRVIEESMVSYVLNMTASTIKMLVEINSTR